MKHTKPLLLSLIVLLLASCALLDNGNDSKYINVDYDTLKQDASLLEGTWKWVQSKSYSFLSGEPNYTTPKDSDITKKIIVTDIDHIKFYKNGELEFEGSVEEYIGPIYWGVSKYWFVTSGIASDGVESIYFREGNI